MPQKVAWSSWTWPFPSSHGVCPQELKDCGRLCLPVFTALLVTTAREWQWPNTVLDEQISQVGSLRAVEYCSCINKEGHCESHLENITLEKEGRQTLKRETDLTYNCTLWNMQKGKVHRDKSWERSRGPGRTRRIYCLVVFPFPFLLPSSPLSFHFPIFISFFCLRKNTMMNIHGQVFTPSFQLFLWKSLSLNKGFNYFEIFI